MAPRLEPSSNLEQCMDLVAVGQDVLDLVGDDGVEAAAKGIEFDQFQVRMLCDVLGSPVDTRMVGPLVDDAQVARELAQGSDAVFGEDGQA